MMMMKWVDTILSAPEKLRINVIKAVHQAVRIYRKGKPSKQGIEFEKLLKSDKVELIGFCPGVMYVRASSKDKNDLAVIWDHKFSAPVLLYQLNDSPIMLLVNANVSYNNSILLEIPENSHIVEIRDLKGIIG